MRDLFDPSKHGRPSDRRPPVRPPQDFSGTLRRLDRPWKNEVMGSFLRLLPLTALYLDQLIHLKWSNVRLDDAMLSFPILRKCGRPEIHLVPLSRQSSEIFSRMGGASGRGHLVFPVGLGLDRPIPNVWIAGALRQIGLTKEDGGSLYFRKSFAQAMHKVGWQGDIIETQLGMGLRDTEARGPADVVMRGEMMQAWADMCSEMKSGRTE